MIDRPGDVESLVRPRSALELKRWLASVPGWARRKVRAEWGGKLLTWKQACMLYEVVEPPLPQEVLVVQTQFFQTCPGNVCQFQFSLLRRARCLTAFGNVLHAAPRRLHHLLLHAPLCTAHIAVAKAYGHVVSQLRQLETLQIPIPPVLRDEGFPVFRRVATILVHPRAFQFSAIASGSP